MNQFVPFRKHLRLSGAQKSAILFLCLGEERGGALMQRLDVDELRKITAAISNMGEIDASVVEEVLIEFNDMVRHEGGVTGSIDAARGMLSEFLPEERVDEILEEIGTNTIGNVWKDLSELEPKQLLDFLSQEKNQTLAVILTNMRADASAKFLALLDTERATDVVARMMKMERLPPDTLQNIENTLRENVLVKAGRNAESRIEGQLVSIFNKLDEDLMAKLSKDLGQREPEQFKVIQQKMFVFDDLTKFSENMLGKIMREVTGRTLPLALRGAKKEVREYFLGSLPSRSRDMLQDEMSSMGPVKARDVKDAQAQLVEAALRLMADGTVELPEAGEDMLEDMAD